MSERASHWKELFRNEHWLRGDEIFAPSGFEIVVYIKGNSTCDCFIISDIVYSDYFIDWDENFIRRGEVFSRIKEFFLWEDICSVSVKESGSKPFSDLPDSWQKRAEEKANKK